MARNSKNAKFFENCLFSAGYFSWSSLNLDNFPLIYNRQARTVMNTVKVGDLGPLHFFLKILNFSLCFGKFEQSRSRATQIYSYNFAIT